MINIRSINKLANNDGLTLKAGKPISYKSGWQVATEGVECRTARGHQRCQGVQGQLRRVVQRRRVLRGQEPPRQHQARGHGDRQGVQSDLCSEVGNHGASVLLSPFCFAGARSGVRAPYSDHKAGYKKKF